ncbi:uncharacterized mitochondrial protein AtMg00810-like [Rutidosis leptorrhynchoides]|uniref:uncharacterized mitochondrial protein AtMg00810-like n=1 Tax=Rutidosis leptorrhynchoides TaxID=125765 RepID=UPI003A98D3F8
MSMLKELHFFLGLEVKQLPKGIFIGQSKYISDMFKKFNFPEMKIRPTPMSINISLHADLNGQPFDQTLYRSQIGSLMYLTASRPDIHVCYRVQNFVFSSARKPSIARIIVLSENIFAARKKCDV